MTRRHIFWLWLPLAISFTLMMLEGPIVQAAIARLGDPTLNIAAYSLVISIALIIESPVIMLLSTAIALVRTPQSYRALRGFVNMLNVGLTLLTALTAWSPLYGLIVNDLLGIPASISAAAQPALQIMLFWTAAIGVRRFYQGILVRHGQTKLVSYGTAIRMSSIAATSVGLALWSGMPGAQVGALALMVGVIAEALVIYLFARPLVRREYLRAQPIDETEPPLTLGAIASFHLPLAVTSLLTLAIQPITSAALARLNQPTETLAAWPVVFSALLVLRGWGLALQETAIAQAHERRALRPLHDFTLIVAVGTTLAAALLTLTPLLDLYLGVVISLEPPLWSYVHSGLLLLILLPGLTALTSELRGLLVAAGTTGSVYRGMGVNLAVNSAVLGLGVALDLAGIQTAAAGMLLATGAEYMYLRRRAARLAEQQVVLALNERAA
jgi:hypothetical protein